MTAFRASKDNAPQVHKKAALESLLNLAPSKISADVLEHVKADLAALEKSIEKAP